MLKIALKHKKNDYNISEKLKEYNKKIIVIYILTNLITILKIISIKNMLIVCFVIYFEILIENKHKNIILRNLSFKLN